MRRPGGSVDVPLLLFAAALLVYVVSFTSLWAGFLDPLFHDSDRYPRGIDFYSVYQAGDALVDGRSIYEWPPPPDVVPISFPFRYLPFVAWSLALPLTASAPEPAYWLWIGVLQALVALNAWLAFRLANDRDWGLVAAALWLTFTPLYLELYMGQFSLAMATLMFLAIAALLRGRFILSALPWSLSISLKSNSALLLPLYVRLNAWRTIAISLAAAFVFNAPYFIARPSDIREFWDVNFGDYTDAASSRFEAFETGDLGLLSFIRTLWLSFDSRAADMPAAVSIIVAVSIVTGSLMATLRGREADITALFAIWSGAYFLLYSDVWEHHYVMLLPALSLLVARRPDLRLVSLVVWMLLAIPTPYLLFETWLSDRPPDELLLPPELFWPEWAGIVYHASKAVPVFGLWSLLCLRAIRPSAEGLAGELAARTLSEPS